MVLAYVRDGATMIFRRWCPSEESAFETIRLWADSQDWPDGVTFGMAGASC